MAKASRGLKKIIMVDDVSFSLLMGKNALKDFYDVYTVQSVEAMFHLLEKIKPDLILLDVNMPGTDGFEGIKKLKADERYAEIPVIFLTAKSDKNSIIKGISLGAVDHVPKPFSAPLLLERIDYALNPDKRRTISIFGDEEETPDDNRLSLLAVDDSPSMLKSLHYALRERYKVYTLQNGDKVADFLKKKTPNMFLLDYRMPGLSGFDLIPIIREFPEHKETPIIFITSEGMIDLFSTAMYLGAADFVVKPFNTTILIEKIEKHIHPKTEGEDEEEEHGDVP